MNRIHGPSLLTGDREGEGGRELEKERAVDRGKGKTVQ
jgi:hypothetical protein